MSFVSPVAFVLLSSKLIPLVPDELRGRVTAAMSILLFFSGLSALGPVFAGGLVGVLGSLAPVALGIPALFGAVAVTGAFRVRSFFTSPRQR